MLPPAAAAPLPRCCCPAELHPPPHSSTGHAAPRHHPHSSAHAALADFPLHRARHARRQPRPAKRRGRCPRCPSCPTSLPRPSPPPSPCSPLKAEASPCSRAQKPERARRRRCPPLPSPLPLATRSPLLHPSSRPNDPVLSFLGLHRCSPNRLPPPRATRPLPPRHPMAAVALLPRSSHLRSPFVQTEPGNHSTTSP